MKCLSCHKNMKKTIQDYRYVDCGLKNIILKDIVVYTCETCDEEDIGIPNVEGLHDLIATTLALQERRLLPEEIRFIRTHLGFSGVDFSKAIGVVPETISRWELGKANITAKDDKLLKLLVLFKFKPKLDYDYIDKLDKIGSVQRERPARITLQMTRNVWREAA